MRATTDRAPIEFRAKIEEIFAPENVLAGGAPLYRRIKVPAIKRNHCDMHRFRCESRKYGSYANSDLFLAMLGRALKENGIGEYIRLDSLPECVQVDESGFLAKVSIFLPLD